MYVNNANMTFEPDQTCSKSDK